ncbi:dipeptide epimerase [Fibrivirga algicola]|uniref:Dipeptide epimerase n=1 Tax=Fibrivirga algicola TaxID=2950420 RepID=A0ABX0QCC8_9BACT|nr:dipeptide epimerase [Fibrivirga algicola]NID08886.1 dipeptide epimerase [Fibrivirga algicola]
MELLLHRFDLRLRHTFTIAHDSRDVQETLVVELRDGDLSGFGEATANAYYGITIDRMITDLGQLRPQIEAGDWASAEALWAQLHDSLKTNPFAQCALDEAAHDLMAKRAGKPLYVHWGLSIGQIPLTNFTIGLDTPEVMLSKMQEMPWPLYKIKLGRGDDDLALLRLLRHQADARLAERDWTPPGPVRFRVDANCGWTADQTLAYAPTLIDLGVEFIEQPLPADDWAGMARLRADSPLPIMADESCITEADVARCADYFHGINIKLTKCGGLTPARRMIADARQRELRVMVGCMTESSVGISAIAHLLPLLDYVDMDGSLLITNDPATGVTFDYGQVRYAAENGTGAALVG